MDRDILRDILRGCMVWGLLWQSYMYDGWLPLLLLLAYLGIELLNWRKEHPE
jgi:hypothetical protein